MNDTFDLLTSSVSKGVLVFLTENHDKDKNVAKRIVAETGFSRKGVHDALKKLTASRLVLYRQIGRSKVYEINSSQPVIRQFKVLRNIIQIIPLVDKLKKFTGRIILYGSCSRGEDTAESDIDLAVITEVLDHEEVKSILASFRSKRKINAGIFTRLKYLELERKDIVYYREIDRGISLWEGKNER